MKAIAQDEVCSDPPGDTAIQQEICIQKELDLRDNELIVSVINFLLGIAGSLAVLFIIIGGVRYATAGDGKDDIEQARKIIRAALTGLILILIAFALVRAISSAILTGT